MQRRPQQQQLARGPGPQQAQRNPQYNAIRGPPTQQLGNPDFLHRLEKAEQRDSMRGPDPARAKASAAGITVDNWEQRSKQIAQLAMHNEIQELMAKEAMGKLPSAPEPPPQKVLNAQMRQPMPQQMTNGRMQPGMGAPQQQSAPQGYSRTITQNRQPNVREAMELERRQQQQMQQQQMFQQQQQQAMGRQQMQAPVQMGGGFDPWDDRVPRQLQAGGSIMDGRSANQARRGQSSSIVFG
jgi:hypothetical protein